MWPNETTDYRGARNALLAAEAELRAKAEEVAAMRRALPPGGVAKSDYVFQDASSGRDVRLSELFGDGRDTLLVYSFMYAPEGNACPMCTSLLDSLDRAATQIERRASLVVVAKNAPGALSEFAKARGWKNLRLLSSGANSYNRDYRAETEDGSQLPMMHVWRKSENGVSHFWASELFMHDDSHWQNHPRHMDMLWPLWNVLDLTPDGRGSDWYPEN